jgi:phenylalanyl-tRNA synthetase beta chain
MKVSLNWLNDYVAVGSDAEAVAETLSDLGFPCEGIESVNGEWVIDVEVTSNRGDCLGYLGIARELAAATGKPWQRPDVHINETQTDVSTLAAVEIQEPHLCARYTARVIEGVTVGPSPEWMKHRLETVGMRSVNNVVDATNYAMLETGQPPHAFDYAKIRNGRIVVRRAKKGETLVSIDGSLCKLTPEMLIIADPGKPIAVAGVMGGLDTEVSDMTQIVLLEDAYFDPVSVRTTSRALALPSEASFRFERTVDIAAVEWASWRTAQLIVQVAGGRIARGVIDAYPKPAETIRLCMRLSRLAHVLGISVPEDEVLRILKALAFDPSREGDVVHCTVPSWRSDMTREVDVIEEVARCYGYGKIPTEQKIEIQVTAPDQRQKYLQAIGTCLNACGYFETINVDFVDETLARLFVMEQTRPPLSVKDASRKGMNILRQTLLGSLLSAFKTNVHVGNQPCQLFEIANTFVPLNGKGQLPRERTQLALVSDRSFMDLRGAVERVIRTMVREAHIDFTPCSLPWARSGAEISVNGQSLGVAGEFSDVVYQTLEIKNIQAVGAEIDFDRLVQWITEFTAIKTIPRYPAIERDLSIIVDDKILWADIQGVINSKAPEELEDIRFVEIYRGKGIENKKKSITLSLRFRDRDGTLTHETVDGFQSGIISALQQQIHATLRTV